MNLKSGFPYSLIRNGLVTEYPKLSSDKKVDVAILGAGISGALCAYHLVQAGYKCIAIDARSVGLGSTCASTSLLQYEIDIPLHKLALLIGEDEAIRSYKICEEAITKLRVIAKKIGFKNIRPKKSVYYAATATDLTMLRAEFKMRKKAGFNVKWQDEKDIEENLGFRAPGAIVSAAGAETDAYMFTHALHKYCIGRGLEVYDRTEATSIHHSRSNVTLITKEGCKITAKKLVYATGFEVGQYLDKPIMKLHSTYAIISEVISHPTPFWKENMMIWNTADPYLYIRTTNDNRIIVGGRDEDFYAPKRRDKLIPSKSRQLVKDFKKLFPDLGFEIEFSWAGTFGSTRDGLPFIGPYQKLPNGYFALGFGGNGITFSLVAAEMITSMLQGKKEPDMNLFSFDRLGR
jgi:glycine/D-amino acid oxidase-like deaminating enzyme